MPILKEGQLKRKAWESLAETIQQSHSLGKLSQEQYQRSGHGKQEIDSVLTGTEGQGLKVLEGKCADMPGDSDFRF